MKNGTLLTLGATAGLAAAALFSQRGSRAVDPSHVWWHGTSVDNARKIVASSLQGRSEQGRTALAPLVGRAYVTHDLAYALTYAFGGLVLAKWPVGFSVSERYSPEGALVKVGVAPGNCVPDEDWLGELMMDCVKDQLNVPTMYDFARSFLSDEAKSLVRTAYLTLPSDLRSRWRTLKNKEDIATWARSGKTAIHALSKTERGRILLQQLVPHAPHLACADTSVRVLGAWALTRENAKILAHDASNLARLGVPLLPVGSPNTELLRLSRKVLVTPRGPIPVRKLGSGTFASAYVTTEEDPPRVFVFTPDDVFDKEILAMAHHYHPKNPHLPHVELFGQTQDKTVWVMPLYKTPLKKADEPVGWREYTILNKCMRDAYAPRLDKSGYQMNEETYDCAVQAGLRPSTLEAIEILKDTASNWSDEYLFEFAPRNLGTDKSGNLIFLDPLFDRERLLAMRRKKSY